MFCKVKFGAAVIFLSVCFSFGGCKNEASTPQETEETQKSKETPATLKAPDQKMIAKLSASAATQSANFATGKCLELLAGSQFPFGLGANHLTFKKFGVSKLSKMQLEQQCQKLVREKLRPPKLKILEVTVVQANEWEHLDMQLLFPNGAYRLHAEGGIKAPGQINTLEFYFSPEGKLGAIVDLITLK